MDGSILEEKSTFMTLELSIDSKLESGSYIISIAKTASEKIWGLICSVKFISPEVALYLCKSTIWPCMKYSCHVWTGAPSAACLEPLAHHWNVASLSLFISVILVNVHLSFLNWFHFLILKKILIKYIYIYEKIYIKKKKPNM